MTFYFLSRLKHNVSIKKISSFFYRKTNKINRTCIAKYFCLFVVLLKKRQEIMSMIIRKYLKWRKITATTTTKMVGVKKSKHDKDYIKLNMTRGRRESRLKIKQNKIKVTKIRRKATTSETTQKVQHIYN